MTRTILPFLILIVVIGCTEKNTVIPFSPPDFSKRVVATISMDSLELGTTYLSIYAQIYTLDQQSIRNLTAMTSLRNTSLKDTIYIKKADYYDTHGQLIRNYLKTPIYLAPLETIEIVIDEKDDEGGTGSNFIFEWQKPFGAPEPLFEGVMTSTLGQQGLSFTTQGRRIE